MTICGTTNIECCYCQPVCGSRKEEFEGYDMLIEKLFYKKEIEVLLKALAESLSSNRLTTQEKECILSIMENTLC